MGKRIYDQPFWPGLFSTRNSIRTISESIATLPVRQLAEIVTRAATVQTALAFSPATETLSPLVKAATDSLDLVGNMGGLDLTAAAASTIS